MTSGGNAPRPGDDSAKESQDEQSQSGRRVPKTMLDINLDDLTGPLMEDAPISPEPSAPSTPTDQPPDQRSDQPSDQASSGRNVAKTMLDINLGDLTEPLMQASASAPEQVSKAQAPKTPPNRPVAKTMLEFDLPDIEAESLQPAKPEEKSETPPKRQVAKTMIEMNLPAAQAQISAHAEAQKAAEPQKNPAPSPPRPVARTMMDVDILNQIGITGEAKAASGEIQSPASVPPQLAQSLKKPKVKRISKTLLDFPINEAERLTPPVEEAKALPAVPERPRQRQDYVARTMLDHSLFTDAVSKSTAKKVLRAAEIQKEKANEPVKPPIEPIKGSRIATQCAWTWSEPDSKDKFRTCEKCHTNVYNFEGMELDEAKALIFTRENKKKPTLYKRADGKFMTQDCPVQVKRKRDLMLLAIGAVLAVVSVVTVVSLLPPPPPPPPKPVEPVIVRKHPVKVPGKTGSASPGGGSKTGVYHFEAGQQVQVQPAVPATTTTTTTTSAAPDPDENGGFWQYSGGPQR